jgi:hypothetical protein
MRWCDGGRGTVGNGSAVFEGAGWLVVRAKLREGRTEVVRDRLEAAGVSSTKARPELRDCW